MHNIVPNDFVLNILTALELNQIIYPKKVYTKFLFSRAKLLYIEMSRNRTPAHLSISTRKVLQFRIHWKREPPIID